MPNRVIKESIRTSENLDQVSSLAESLFTRLIVTVDDYGRYHGHLGLILSACYPLRLKTMTEGQIEELLVELWINRLITRYTVDGRPFICLTTWVFHNRVRNQKSKFPGPQDAGACIQLPTVVGKCQQSKEQADLSTRGQLPATDSKCRRYPIPSNPIQSDPTNENGTVGNGEPANGGAVRKFPADTPPEVIEGQRLLEKKQAELGLLGGILSKIGVSRGRSAYGGH